jgi:hypothetical protein
MAQVFAVSMVALFDPCLSSRLSSPATGTKQRLRQAKEKGDFRDGLQSFDHIALKR